MGLRDLRSERLRFAWLAVVLVATSGVFARAAYAAPRPGEAKKAESCRVDPLDERSKKGLTEAIELSQDEKLDEALAVLDGLSDKRLGNYGRAMALQMRGSIAAFREDYDQAATWYEKSISEAGFCGRQQTSLEFQLGQIYTVLERWDDAVKVLEQVIQDSEEPNGEAYFRVGLAYLQKGDKARSIAATEKAVEIGGDRVKEAWLRLLLILRWERQEYAKSFPIVQQLVLLYPKKDYWKRFAFILMELNREADALIAMQIADLGEYLDASSEVIRVVQMQVVNDMPYSAATRLERAIAEGVVKDTRETLELLGTCWMAARERDRAIEPLTKAAELSDDGDTWLRVARLHVQLEAWDTAASAVHKALDKGAVDHPGHALLLLGLAELNQKDYAQAREAFERAVSIPEVQGMAAEWLREIDRATRINPAADHGVVEGDAS